MLNETANAVNVRVEPGKKTQTVDDEQVGFDERTDRLLIGSLVPSIGEFRVALTDIYGIDAASALKITAENRHRHGPLESQQTLHLLEGAGTTFIERYCRSIDSMRN